MIKRLEVVATSRPPNYNVNKQRQVWETTARRYHRVFGPVGEAALGRPVWWINGKTMHLDNS